MSTENLLSAKSNWHSAFANKAFIIISLLGLLVLITLAILSPYFYSFIENRSGTLIHDKVLQVIPPVNVSVPIFIIIWSTIVLFFVRSIRQPIVFGRMVLAYSIFTSFRYLAIFLVPLEPPVGILELKDPFTDIFYGGSFVTKDLFFSGHLGLEVLFLLVMTKKQDKFILGMACMLLAMLLLVQHVHYTIDVLAAPLFSLLSYLSAQVVLQKFGIIKASSQLAGLPIRFGKA